MTDFDASLALLKQEILNLAKETAGKFAEQAASDAYSYVITAREDIKRWTEQLATGQIDKDMFAYLLNSEQGLGQMKMQTQIGLTKIKADSFMLSVKNMVLNTLVKVAGAAL